MKTTTIFNSNWLATHLQTTPMLSAVRKDTNSSVNANTKRLKSRL